MELASNVALFMESFFHNSVDAISIIGLDSVFQYVNPAFESLYDLEASDVIGKNVWTFWPENPGDFPFMAERVTNGIGVSEFETKRRRPDGREVYVSLTISPMRDSSGKVCAYVTVGRDITEKRRMENRLKEVEALFTSIEENITDICAIVTAIGDVEFASKSHERFLGISNYDITGRSPVHLFHPDDLPCVVEAFHTVIQEGRPEKIECRLKHANGNWLDVEIAMAPISDEGGTVRQVILLSRNITERRASEQFFLQAEKLSVVGQLGAAFAHEIRNPLTSIKGFLQLLREGSNGLHESYFDIVFSEIRTIEQTIGEFLDSVKVDKSTYQMCNVHEVLIHAIAFIQPTAHMHSVRIESNFAKRKLFVWANDKNLKQVFINVLKNAVEAMSSGGTIQVQTTLVDDKVISIQFTDEGIGIRDELLARLGQPFYTTKERGTGLGLTVSTKILHDHDGAMKFSSQPGVGTRVEVRLPCANGNGTNRYQDPMMFKW